MAEVDPARLWTGLAGILLKAHDSTEYPLAPLKTLPTQAPRWQAGISGIDDNILMRGMYGLSVVCGPSKLGKSIVAYQSALQAAMNGWTVVYVDAELDDFQATDRIHHATGLSAVDWCEVNPNFRWRQLFTRCPMQTLVEDVVAQIGEAERVLVVIDSINRAAQWLIKSEKDRKQVEYFDALREITNWALTARRLSRGACSFLFTSERNKRGGTKGEALEFACDLLLQLKGKPDEATAELVVQLSREGGAGSLGKYFRNWERCRFERLGSQDVMVADERPLDLDSWIPPDRRLL